MDDKAKIDVLEERVSNWMESTTEYRKDLCRKIDIITKMVTDLPCKERKGIYESVNKQLGIIWIVVSCVIVAVFAEWIKAK
jgi:hypothetical protein